ncbi:BREX-2 system adenine-specific DNA-methyltransferase PglX [Dactylosporangium sp. NPDC050688]|uniref:BREX-2 system adenine-specific DNA-methyltransferase PglX n=1 Tax=Dactylosporangium sp. NPDC050688 TaxID=3157217 RepID=UPI0034022DAE
MIDRQLLLADLKKQVKLLETDLREQVTAVPEVFERLDTEYKRAFKLGRTAATWGAWRDERVTQAAAAWILGTVFVRFCEDNGLLEQAYLAGPTVERMTHAEEAQEDFFRLKPAETDRGWIQEAFDAIGSTQAGRLLFDKRHNAAYQIPVSADAAKALIGFWRRRGEDGVLIHDFIDPEWDTRFLGDLYQDLSESARKTYALLQTPEFVEEFILDLTLTPAIEDFGYDVVKIIDPTCGSGHFVLEAFDRLSKEWERSGKDPHERSKLALDAVHGVDINPFAVAVARFRLLIAALKVADFRTLTAASGYDFPIHIAIGDALIKHRQRTLFDGEDDELVGFQYATEDLDDHPEVLVAGRYHVVVGNPPYITVKDKNLNDLYRDIYSKVCVGKYALSMPFAQRFFELARGAESDGRNAGYVGQITANSFMKREFGKKLIENYFASEVDLTHVIDTSGAYIPGHGTPTVILIGRQRRQHRAPTVRTVMGIQGEPSAPDDAARGHVWRSIVTQFNNPGREDAWVSVADTQRAQLAKFPWSLSGGGSVDTKGAIETGGSGSILRSILRENVGPASFPGLNDAFEMPPHWHRRNGTTSETGRRFVTGEDIRDWQANSTLVGLAPYSSAQELIEPDTSSGWGRHLWSLRRSLQSLTGFNRATRLESGEPWWSWYRWIPSRYQVAIRLVMSDVATHNHFATIGPDAVVNQHAPVAILATESNEIDYPQLLGVLNSSTACFWLKQVSHNKGRPGAEQAGADEPWEHRYEFSGTKLQEFPLPPAYPTKIATRLDELTHCLAAVNPSVVASAAVPTHSRLAEAAAEWHSTRSRMIALQEELDWQVYALYNLLDDLTAPADSIPELHAGERAFEIVLARRIERGEIETTWFEHHNHRFAMNTKIPSHWPADYRTIVERRIAVIESNRSIGLIERPECKRRWSTDGWDAMQCKALRSWLLDRCEARELWFHSVDGIEQPRPLTASQLADELRRDADVLAVAELYAPGKDFTKVIAELVADEHVPYLATLRYKDSGLDNRAEWEAVWELQRAEDAASDEPAKKKIRDTIPVPPKYGSGDFLKNSYWRNRGKLDVPKERFVSYPLASPDGDPSLLLGWAGWDHCEQAQALATLIVEREQAEGWSADRLTPLLAGLREVLPWVRQWHGDFDPLYGGSPAELYEGFLSEVTGRLHVTDQAMTGWRPPKAARGRPASAT